MSLGKWLLGGGIVAGIALVAFEIFANRLVVLEEARLAVEVAACHQRRAVG